jgi:hypothetical protein
MAMNESDFREKAVGIGEGGGQSNWSEDRVTLRHTNGNNRSRRNIIRAVCEQDVF